MRPWPPLAEIVKDAGTYLTLVICPRLSNPENLGAIARISDVFGVDAILAGPSCPTLFPAEFYVFDGIDFAGSGGFGERCDQIVDDLVVNDHLVVIGAVADPAAEPYDREARPDRVGLVLGEEDEGIEPDWLDRCRKTVTIPMRPGAGSLNVAVAAGYFASLTDPRPSLQRRRRLKKAR